jgi:hypothetical protein
MHPEWLAVQYRDEWIRRRDIVLAQMGFRGKEGLRRYQRGSVGCHVQAAAAQQGAGGDCTFTASTIPNLFEFNIEPTNSFTGGRLHSDGDWYGNATTIQSFGGSDGTWQGGCAVADYDTQWNRISGTIPNSLVSGTDGVFSAATLSKAVGYFETNIGVLSGSFTLVCRDGASLNTLFTDAFTMNCEVETRN